MILQVVSQCKTLLGRSMSKVGHSDILSVSDAYVIIIDVLLQGTFNKGLEFIFVEVWESPREVWKDEKNRSEMKGGKKGERKNNKRRDGTGRGE